MGEVKKCECCKHKIKTVIMGRRKYCNNCSKCLYQERNKIRNRIYYKLKKLGIERGSLQ